MEHVKNSESQKGPGYPNCDLQLLIFIWQITTKLLLQLKLWSEDSMNMEKMIKKKKYSNTFD